MAVGDYFQWLRGTLRTAFKIGKADLDSSGLSAARTLTLQDRAGIIALDKFVISAQNGNFSAGATSEILYECDVSSGNKTVTLTGASAGTVLGFKLTVAPGGNKLLFSQAIDGNASLELSILHAYLYITYDGTNWKIISNGLDGASTLYGKLDALTTKGADIASATTTDIGAATGESVTITGTTTITGLGTKTAGVLRFVTFSGALILTHNATSLILPTAANITTATGDTAIFQSLGSGNWKCLNYARASGAALTGSTTGVDPVAFALMTMGA